MVLRFWALAAVLVLAAAVCPPNTFTCKDGSCIPEDWVGDGEPDCDDRSDETDSAHNSTTHEEDPFDDIITQSPPIQQNTDNIQDTVSQDISTPGSNRTAPTSDEDECPYEHQLRVDECSEPILMFIHEINEIYFENSSLLSDADMQSRVEKGCDLMQEYGICVQGASEACTPDEGVRAWREVEMYACQLLIPAAREHVDCFKTGRDAQCKPRFDRLASPFCRLVTSVSQDVECVQKYNKGCSDLALEMLPPILEESQHIADSIRCAIPSGEGEVEEEVPEEEEPEEIEEPVMPEMTETTEEPAPEMVPETKQVPEVSEEMSSEVEVPMEESAILPSIDEPVSEEMEVPKTAPVSVHDGEVSTGASVASVSDNHGNGRELRINMSDAVNSMYYIYDICSSDYSESLFKSVARKICKQQDLIAKFSDCYQKTLEKSKCAIREVKTECEAIEAFNTNLDCAIVVMNDVCSVEAQDMVIELQEKLNDVSIEKKCFDEQKTEKKTSDDNSEFPLNSTLPRCEDEQENGALACLVELLEINKQLAQFANLNFLLEIASPNSTVVENICELYGRYDQCLHASVFKNGQRCSFASPLNTLARIGLSPICLEGTQSLLASHRECFATLAAVTNSETNCQSGLENLGNSVNMMLNGIHAEALLCKNFYVIRETFTCGERAVREKCDSKALEDLMELKSQISALGVEEGCPAEQPADLDEIIARPVNRTRPVMPPNAAPIARPLTPAVVRPVPPPRPAAPTVSPACAPEHQKRFEECVHPLTAFQPHPLSVIKLPRQIKEACAAFETFKTCVETVDCHPLWARGMTAMFEYACGEGAEGYTHIRQCLRKTSAEEVVRDCVSTFSRGAPQQACLSANRLLSCSMATIQTECGGNATEWVSSYVTKFATAIDPRCKLASQLPVGKVVGVGCSAEEEAIIEHCAAPLNDIGARMEGLFQGGLQTMIKNINGLAPVFAGGCNLTDEFRTCASFLLSGRTPCIVSSCMIKAGNGICDQPDPAQAIDDNLSCVFGQIQEPTFAKCIRTTLSTVKKFTLNSFRNVLPRFVDCTEEIVRAKCGETPINVLRAISSPELCPVGPASIGPVSLIRQPVRVTPTMPTCTEEKRVSYEQCARPFYTKYRMLPVALLNEVDNVEQVCSDVAMMDGCSVSTRICASPQQLALKKMIQQLCSRKTSFEQHKICLKTVATQKEGASCMSQFMTSSPTDRCAALNDAANCMAEQVKTSCGNEALTFSFTIMAEYAKMLDSRCEVTAPAVSLETGCTEEDLLQYLSCESNIDKFSFRPISVIGDASKLDEFCDAFTSQYKPCVEAMKCRFEPVSTANINLMGSICNNPVMKEAQTSHGKCLAEYTNSETGRKCIEKMAAVDPLSQDAETKMCSTLDSILSCSSDEIEKKCGYEALLHVVDLHSQWGQQYNPTCVIQTPPSQSAADNSLEESRDATPMVVVHDDTTPPMPMTSPPTTAEPTTTAAPTTTHPKDIHVKSGPSSLFAVALAFFISFALF